MSDISIQRLETEPEKIMSECEKLQEYRKNPVLRKIWQGFIKASEKKAFSSF
jgi:hypothetical protein